MRTILFVCTGNTCRSPMAEALFNKLLADKGITDIKAQSAGLAAEQGAPASQNAVAAVSELSIDLSGHKARQVTQEMISGCYAVYAMTKHHAELLKAVFPHESDKIEVLGDGIQDPFGGDIAAYKSCRNKILAALNNIIKKVK